MSERHESEVDERTVAEKHGRAVEVTTGRRPPPPGWPAEAFRYPLRRPGPATIAGGAAFWVLLDLATRWNLLLGLLFKIAAWIVFARWQIKVAARSAAGHDVPPPWGHAIEMDREEIIRLGWWFVAAVMLLAPGILVLHFGSAGVGLVLLGVAGLWMAVDALGLAIGRTGLKRPWKALPWIGRHPFGLLAATVGWWAAGLSEWAVFALRSERTGIVLLVSVPVRIVFAYLLFVSARALGVVGRDDGGD